MLDIRFIRENADALKRAAVDKRIACEVDRLIAVDQRRRELQVELDASWEDKMGDVLWRQVKKKNVLDFAKWKTKAFDAQFQKLLNGLKIYYEKPGAK